MWSAFSLQRTPTLKMHTASRNHAQTQQGLLSPQLTSRRNNLVAFLAVSNVISRYHVPRPQDYRGMASDHEIVYTRVQSEGTSVRLIRVRAIVTSSGPPGKQHGTLCLRPTTTQKHSVLCRHDGSSPESKLPVLAGGWGPIETLEAHGRGAGQRLGCPG